MVHGTIISATKLEKKKKIMPIKFLGTQNGAFYMIFSSEQHK